MLERMYVEAKLADLQREREAMEAARPYWQARAEARRAGLKSEGIVTRLFFRRRAVVAVPAEPTVAQAA